MYVVSGLSELSLGQELLVPKGFFQSRNGMCLLDGSTSDQVP